MLTTQRKKAILELLTRDGQVLAAPLAATFGVSEDTIRRDLREMAADGLLQRVHGGALPASSAVAPFSTRRTLESLGKSAIGMAAAAMIVPGQIVMIDGGTTSAELVRHLPSNLVATVERARESGNLSSTLRLFVLESYRQRAAGRAGEGQNGAGAPTAVSQAPR